MRTFQSATGHLQNALDDMQDRKDKVGNPQWLFVDKHNRRTRHMVLWGEGSNVKRQLEGYGYLVDMNRIRNDLKKLKADSRGFNSCD